MGNAKSVSLTKDGVPFAIYTRFQTEAQGQAQVKED